MRKIFAYILTVVTLVAMMVFFVPNVKENTNFAMEYTGGFEVLYEIKSSMKDVKDSKVAKTISDGMNKILDINGINDSIITVEDGNYIRVNVTSKSQIISDEIRNLIQNNDSYEITFRDAEDNLLATGKEILEVEGASYDGELNYYGQPIIYLNIKDTDLLYEITSQISQSSTDKNLVIWVGFEEGVDSYANIETESSTAKKVIYNATVSEALDDEVITVTGNYTEDAAKNTVNLVNSGTYEYEDLKNSIVQVKSIKVDEANNKKTLILIALAVTIFLALAAMVVFFKLEGAYAIPTVLFNEFLMIFFFNKIAGVINPQVVSAFILANIVMFGLLFIILNKYKSVLKNNKSPLKAFKETYKKNTPIVLDTLVTVILLSLVTYFLGNNAEHFSILLAVSSIATMLCLLLLERLVLYLTCDCFNKNDKAVIISSSNYNTETSESEVEEKKNIDAYSKPVVFSFLGLLSLGLIVILVTTLAFKSPFTLLKDANKGSTIEIITNQEYFKNEAEVKEFFDQDELKLEVSNVKFNTSDNKYIVTISSEESIAIHEEALKAELIELCGENTDFVENYVVYINDNNPTALLISLKSALYTAGLGLLVVSLYFALRYKYSYSLATVTTTLMTVISLVAFFGITRIPVNNSTIIGITIVTVYSLFMLVPFFTKIKEYIKDNKKTYLSYQERIECFKKGRSAIMFSLCVITLLFDAFSLIIMFFDLANFSMYLAFIIGSLFALVYNLVLVPKIWILFENKSDKRKKTFKNKNISNSKFRTIDEQVFIGVND